MDDISLNYMIEKDNALVEVFNSYVTESVYEMGNPYALDENECAPIEIAKEIIIQRDISDENHKQKRLDAMEQVKIAHKNLKEAEKLKSTQNRDHYVRLAQAEYNSANDVMVELLQREEEKAEEVVDTFTRKGGLIERLKKDFDFDVKLFKNTHSNQAEISKILYFIHMLEYKHIPDILNRLFANGNDVREYFNIIQFLKQPSMENMVSSISENETYNGIISRLLLHFIEKEISTRQVSPLVERLENKLEEGTIIHKNYIESAVWNAALVVDKNMMEIHAAIGVELELFTPHFDEIFGLTKVPDIITNIVSVPIQVKYRNSPIETIYLKILQHILLGYTNDYLNFIDTGALEEKDDMPVKFQEELWALKNAQIQLDDIEDFIRDESSFIARYIYYTQIPNKENYRTIRNRKNDVIELINTFKELNSLSTAENGASVLMIISCLQHIILDPKMPKYKFRGSQTLRDKSGNKRAVDAEKAYKIHRVLYRSYHNLGLHDELLQLRFFDRRCKEIQQKIFSCPNLTQMQRLNDMFVSYLKNVNAALIKVVFEQIDL